MKPRHLLTILALSPQASSLHDAVNYPVDGNVRGLAFADADIASNRYLYNGKELEDYTLGTSYLGTLDYGARHYDPRIARWTVPDPMAEKYYGVNAYDYCAGNPVMMVDTNGMDIYLKDIAEYENKIPKYAYSRAIDGDYGPYSINAYFNENDEIVGYSAVKFVNVGKSREARLDYVMTNPTDLDVFAENVSLFSAAADLTYANGDLSHGMIQMIAGEKVPGLTSLWKENLRDPSFYLGASLAIGFSFLYYLDPILTFGNDPNQAYHAFRHVEREGLSRSSVKRACRNDFLTSINTIRPGKPYNRTIIVDGHILQYTVYLRENGEYNIGRIQVNK